MDKVREQNKRGIRFSNKDISRIWKNLRYVIREKFYNLLKLLCTNFGVHPTNILMLLSKHRFSSENLMLNSLTNAKKENVISAVIRTCDGPRVFLVFSPINKVNL